MEKEHKSKIEKIRKPITEMELKVPSEKTNTDNQSSNNNNGHSQKKKVIKIKKFVQSKELLPPPDETVLIEKAEELVKIADSINKAKNDKPELGQHGRKKPAPKFSVPLYIFTIAALFIAFGIGALFAKVIPPFSFGFIDKLNIQRAQNNVQQEVVQTPPAETTPEPIVEEEHVHILKTQPPLIDARAYGVYHLHNEDGEYREITNRDANMTLPMASITKVMTAIIAIERYDLDKPVAIPLKCVGINGSNVGFKANEVFTLQDLLYGLLVKSGADAACAIANIEDETAFIQTMNEKAAEFGMTGTVFTNPIGFDYENSHVSNINDIKILVTEALNYSEFRKIVGTGEITIISKSNGAAYKVRNTNELLFSIPGTVGLKTGYTDTAGECLAYLYQNKDQEIMIIVLGSLDRFGDTAKLLNWAKTELAE